jgi:hypothetical protein
MYREVETGTTTARYEVLRGLVAGNAGEESLRYDARDGMQRCLIVSPNRCSHAASSKTLQLTELDAYAEARCNNPSATT